MKGNPPLLNPSNNESDKKPASAAFIFFFNICTILVIVAVEGVTGIIALNYSNLGWPGLGEFAVSSRFFSVLVGSVLFPVMIKKLNYKRGILLFGFGTAFTSLPAMITTSCHYWDRFFCGLGGLYTINFVCEVVAGLLGPSFILGTSSYIQQISSSKSQTRNIVMISSSVFGSSLVGNLCATFIIPASNPFVYFSIITIQSFLLSVVLYFMTSDVDPSYFDDSSTVLKSVQNIWRSVKTQTGFGIFMISFLDGAINGNYAGLLYRDLRSAINRMGIANHDDKEMIENAAVVLYGVGGIGIAIVISFILKCFQKTKHFYISGFFFSFLDIAFIIICKSLRYYNYPLVACAYAVYGMTLSQLKSGIYLVSFKHKEFKMQLLALFRAGSRLGTAIFSFICFLFLNQIADYLCSGLEFGILILCIYLYCTDPRMYAADEPEPDQEVVK